MEQIILPKFKKGIKNTNCFFSIDTIRQKIENKELEVVHDNFFLGLIEKSEYDFSRLYFYIENKSDFELNILKDKRELVIDVIFADRKKNNWIPIIEKFRAYDFKEYAIFNRMALGNPRRIENYKSDNVSIATNKDLSSIKMFLEENFDIYAERIPTINELEKLSQTTYVVKKEGNIAALLISEKKGFTEELRYWLVRQKYRGKGFGSILMKYFLNHHSDTTRFLLWVQKNNESAIEKYKHFGFKKDNLNMNILRK